MGAMSTICYLNLTPPTTKTVISTTPSFPNKTIINTHLSWTNKDWGKQWAIGVACVVISLEILGNVEGMAMAKEDPAPATATATAKGRWSEKRMCPSWKINSLEIIVPENLPRPVTRRRWESVGYVKAAATIANSCFKM